jgi:hypothetical protein
VGGSLAATRSRSRQAPGLAAGLSNRHTHRLVLAARRSGHTLGVWISDAPVGAKCSLDVAASGHTAAFTARRVGKDRSAKITWSVPTSAPGGVWSLVVTCVRGNRRLFARTKIRWPGKGSGPLVASVGGGGKGGGNQSCEPIVEGGSGEVCFIDDPFASYGEHPGEDIGQCTWYAAGMRSDLDGVVTGNAGEWLREARGRVPEGTTPVVGAIAVSETADHGIGHVAYVAGVENGGATLVLDEANLQPPQHPEEGGVYLNITTPASGFQGYIYGGPAGNGPGGSGGSSGGGTGTAPATPGIPIPGGPSISVAIGFLEASGNFEVKEGLAGSWTTETTGASKIALAPGASGPVLGVLDGSENFAVKEGIGGIWTTETSGAEEIALAPGPHGPVIGFLDNSGNFAVKEGIDGAWTQEATGASRIALAAGANGPIIGFLDNSGNFSVKEGIDGSWTTETTSASQIALAHGANGAVIGFLDDSGNFAVKEGIGSTWTQEATGASRIALAAGANGPVIGFLDHSGNFAVKEGIGTSWTVETSSASQIALAAGNNGPVIGFLEASGNVAVKEGIGGAWTTETTAATAIALA